MERAKSISKSMMSYLKRAREHKEFLHKETVGFARGKRHLANIMGLDEKAMTQDDIDAAITYLFPSGLFEPRARPVMKHPDLIFKAQKDAQFDTEGRPHHYLFYTAKPNYYETLSKISDIIRQLNAFEDSQLAEGIIDPPTGSSYRLVGRVWMTKDQANNKFLEQLRDSEHEYLIKSLTDLTEHPYSSREKEFIESFTTEVTGQSVKLVLPEIQHNEETGERFTEMVAQRRSHEVYVKTVLVNGSGKFEVEGQDILFFRSPHFRRTILCPLQLTGFQDKVDIFAKIIRRPVKLGEGCISNAIRYCVSMSIAAIVDPDTQERMRLAGLLTRDPRVPERKKPGQEGARRKFTWKKR